MIEAEGRQGFHGDESDLIGSGYGSGEEGTNIIIKHSLCREVFLHSTSFGLLNVSVKHCNLGWKNWCLHLARYHIL